MDDLIEYGVENIGYLEGEYAKFLKEPTSVESSFRSIFDRLSDRQSQKSSYAQSSSLPALSSEILATETREGGSIVYYPRLEINSSGDLRIYHLIEAYRTYGHLLASVNPISTHELAEPKELNLENLGFSKLDLTHEFPTCGILPKESAPLLEIIRTLKAIYCGTIGYEYMGLESPDLEAWIQERVEPQGAKREFSIEKKRAILQHLNKSELFESFIHTKYVGQKRFSLEGGECLIPILAEIIDIGAHLEVEEFVLGMPHRGRLNVLANILDKSYAEIFSEFEEGYIPASVEGSSDVKYHKGFYSERKTVDGHPIKVVLTPNPSHLESVDPVVEGQALARQIAKNDEWAHKKVLPILIHGDASIAGQGVVYETMQLYRLPGYSTGGTIHIIVNNQIGFTTLPRDARSTYYCSDIARAFRAPVFHVNGEDPEGCIYATILAMGIRQQFHCDVFLDLNCYRKYGHNESDEPAFTQPLEYKIIRNKSPVRDLYREALIQQGVLEKFMAEALEEEFKKALHAAQKGAQGKNNQKKEESMKSKKEELPFAEVSTKVSAKTLEEVGKKLCTLPEGFTVHPKIAHLLKERSSMLTQGGRPIDWGMAELLSYGTLLEEGIPVRLSGQDCCRGTFSHRHAVFVDQVKEQEYISLKNIKPSQGRFDVYNSPLSEYAVLGFEFGYSVAAPEGLTIWEAQFGDFCNGAQIIIDQFISTAEQKWGQKSSLVMLLPHGYEGQGPEHSSARIERFLTLCGHDNMIVVYPTTPAQFFHLLRRQALSPTKKPMIVFTPKSLLRHPSCTSSWTELTGGSFSPILDDPSAPKKPQKIVLCTGRIYYDLEAERVKRSRTDEMAILRIEQLYPLDIDLLKKYLNKYKGYQELYWVQEEPSNMGAWGYMYPILRTIQEKEPQYIGRERSASPASGSHAIHKKEHAALLEQIYGKNPVPQIKIADQFKA